MSYSSCLFGDFAFAQLELSCSEGIKKGRARHLTPMKTQLSLALLLIAGVPHAVGDSASQISVPDVLVARIALTLPADTDAASKVLWDTFANKPEEMKFATVTQRDW